MPKHLLATIIIFLMFATFIRSWLGASYSKDKSLIYPLLILSFQYGMAIFSLVGVFIIVIIIFKFKRVGWLLPLLAIVVFICIGFFGVMLTLPDLRHLASVQFNQRVYHLVSDARFEEDSTPVPTAYLVFQCDSLGITCQRRQVVYRDETVDEKRVYQRRQLKSEFVINADENALYAKIDEQMFRVNTDSPIKEDS